MEVEDFQAEQLVQLTQTYEGVLQQNAEQTKLFTECRDKYKKIAAELQNLRKELKVNCMVPIGKKAFMKGQLVHTNEILALIGDGHFVKYSAEQAVGLCDRRIKYAEEMLDKLVKERNLFETRQTLALNCDIFGNESAKKLEQHWDDKKLEEWRVEHRKKEKEYRQKLKELENREPPKLENEDDLFKRLEELEIQEELEDEYNRLQDERRKIFGEESSEDSDTEAEDDSVETEEEKNEPTDQNVPTETKKPDSTTVQKDVRINGKFEVSRVSDDAVQNNFSKKSCNRRRVCFGDPQIREIKNDESVCAVSTSLRENVEKDSSDDVIEINFKHSNNEPSVIESNENEINSPSDVYKLFNKPVKSILKRSPDDLHVYGPNEQPEQEYSSDDESEASNHSPVNTVNYNSIVKDIQERIPEKPIAVQEKVEEPKFVSRFKRERANLRK